MYKLIFDILIKFEALLSDILLLLAAPLSLICIVLGRSCYACFILKNFFGLFSVECFWDFVCESLSACVYSMCTSFVLSLFPLIHNFMITLLNELLQFCLMYKDKLLMYIFHVMKLVTCSEFF